MKVLSIMLAMILAMVPMTASAAISPAGAERTIVHEGESVLLVREMMALDYEEMTVAQFNETIQKLCADAGTNIFEVIVDAYSHYATYDATGTYVGTVFTDKALKAFMQTTLEYSAQEIFGEPVQTGSIMYITMPGVNAMEMHNRIAEMADAEWHEYFEKHIAEITIFPVLSYAIEVTQADPDTLLVGARDSRINGTIAAINNLLLAMDEDAVRAETLWDTLEAAFERISAEQSDDEIAIVCKIQGLERDVAGIEAQ